MATRREVSRHWVMRPRWVLRLHKWALRREHPHVGSHTDRSGRGSGLGRRESILAIFARVREGQIRGRLPTCLERS